MLRSAERAFGVDHPLGAEQSPQHGRKSSGLDQTRQAAMEAEFAGRVQFPQSGPELSPKHPAEDPHRQKESGARRNPLRVVGRQPAGRSHTMYVGMMAPAPTIPRARIIRMVRSFTPFT